VIGKYFPGEGDLGKLAGSPPPEPQGGKGTGKSNTRKLSGKRFSSQSPTKKRKGVWWYGGKKAERAQEAATHGATTRKKDKPENYMEKGIHCPLSPL